MPSEFPRISLLGNRVNRGNTPHPLTVPLFAVINKTKHKIGVLGQRNSWESEILLVMVDTDRGNVSNSRVEDQLKILEKTMERVRPRSSRSI